jgi:hypothetical protein
LEPNSYMQAVTLLELHDPVFNPSTRYSSFDKLWLKRLNDERDLPFVYLTIQITVFMLPAGILLFMPFVTGILWWCLAAFYFILNNFVFKGPFGLMLHCTSHRPWFKPASSWLNKYLPWIVGPFFGQTPETYASHHLAMHHRENNLEDDLSSTMHYQRDSFRGFLKYFISFFFTVIPSLAGYFHARSQRALRNKVLRGEIVFFTVCIALCFVSWQATLWVFLVPLVISRMIMMVGNWAQHSFVDADDPGNFYKNSITCINTKYNHKCWNDGYHISHHIKPNLHWTLHPEHLQRNLAAYAEHKALVFEGIHFLHVWWYLMNRNYNKLAQHIVNLNGMFASRDEAIRLMRTRTRCIPKRREQASAT